MSMLGAVGLVVGNRSDYQLGHRLVGLLGLRKTGGLTGAPAGVLPSYWGLFGDRSGGLLLVASSFSVSVCV